MKALAVRWVLDSGEAVGFGRGALPLPALTSVFGATLSSAGTTGCALHGASLFLVWPRKSNQKEGHPYIRTGRPRFAAQNFPRFGAAPGGGLGAPSRRAIPGPSLLARHPCLATPYATPTLSLLKGIRDRGAWKCPSNESKKSLRLFLRARPDRRHQDRRGGNAKLTRRYSKANFDTADCGGKCFAVFHPTEPACGQSCFSIARTARRRQTPLSEGRMESAWRGASGMDAARGVKGHGWPLCAGPRSVDGMREVERSETRMQGQDFLVPFGATAKRDSPSRAKPLPQPTTTKSHHTRSQSHYQLAATCSGCITAQVLPC
jgi:hypothetical protein